MVTTPALPSVAIQANASGTPPKLASTPEAVSTASRSARNREVTTACARNVPSTAPATATTADSLTLPISAVR